MHHRLIRPGYWPWILPDEDELAPPAALNKATLAVSCLCWLHINTNLYGVVGEMQNAKWQKLNSTALFAEAEVRLT